MKKYYISLDVGGTHCRIGLMENEDSNLKIVDQKKFTVHPEFEPGIKELSNQIKGIACGYKIEGIGGSFPGSINYEKGIIESASNLPKWAKHPVKQKLEGYLHVPLKMLHDVGSGAMGEAVYGEGKNENNFIFMIWGTGFGGTKVERLLGKFHLTKIESGHHIADRNGEKCNCGLHGCPELFIGGGFLSKRLGRNLAEIEDDNPIWENVIEIASQALVNTVKLNPSDLIIFGGGLILRRPFLLDRLDVLLKKELREDLQVKLKIAKLGDDAALYGAVAFQQVEII